MPLEWIGLFIIGVVAGVFSGMFGIGGGVVIVPALTVFLGYTTVEAISTSLAALLLPVAVFAVFAYYRAGLLEVRAAALLAFGLVVTTWLGASITLSLPADTLRQVYGLFLIFIGWRFAEPRTVYAEWQTGRTAPKVEPTSPAALPDTPAGTVEIPSVPWYIILAVGLGAGVASGMFGIGGGAVIVPALVAFFNYDQKLAVGTSLGALLLPVALPGVLRYAEDGVLDITVAVLVAAGLLAGAILGARIALNLPSKTVKRLYGLFLFFVAARFILGA
jgi:uncharacterized protein